MNVHPDILVQSDKWHKALPNLDDLVQGICSKLFTHEQFKDYFPKDVELSIVFTDDAAIQELNASYRNKDKPTNVLSFPNFDLEPGEPFPKQAVPCECILGDVVIAIETVGREAKEQSKPLASHVSHMLVHGILHLLGYNHEAEKEAETMEALEVEILVQLGIGNPYEMDV